MNATVTKWACMNVNPEDGIPRFELDQWGHMCLYDRPDDIQELQDQAPRGTYFKTHFAVPVTVIAEDN